MSESTAPVPQDRIERTLELDAPVERVWQALTDFRKFGEWFRVELDGPFVVGEYSNGVFTFPGCEGTAWHARIEAMDEPSYFAFHWHPGIVAPDEDVSGEPMTRVEFHLTPLGRRTRLELVESGFAALAYPRAVDALRMNIQGWNEQLDNLSRHVGG